MATATKTVIRYMAMLVSLRCMLSNLRVRLFHIGHTQSWFLYRSHTLPSFWISAECNVR